MYTKKIFMTVILTGLLTFANVFACDANKSASLASETTITVANGSEQGKCAKKCAKKCGDKCGTKCSSSESTSDSSDSVDSNDSNDSIEG